MRWSGCSYKWYCWYGTQKYLPCIKSKAVARKVAEQLNHKYEDLNLLVTHMGGGITVGAHKKEE